MTQKKLQIDFDFETMKTSVESENLSQEDIDSFIANVYSRLFISDIADGLKKIYPDFMKKVEEDALKLIKEMEMENTTEPNINKVEPPKGKFKEITLSELKEAINQINPDDLAVPVISYGDQNVH